MSRKLFCEISPITYKISRGKEIGRRKLENLVSGKKFAKEKSDRELPIIVCQHNSLIRRKLGNVDIQLQENKAENLSLAAPMVNKLLIKAGETFSFWTVVGECNERKGYKVGLTISGGEPKSGVGGGMCQFTNLIHWMILHSPLEVTEHHHHNGLDLFPDFNRQVPFGVGTSITYNYLDYQFTNNTNQDFQLITYVEGEYLCGELRTEKELENTYHIKEEDAYFTEEEGICYRHNKIYRYTIDKRTGETIEKELIIENKAKVMYDKSFIAKDKFRE